MLRAQDPLHVRQQLGVQVPGGPLAERALAIDEAAYGPDHPAVGTALGNLFGRYAPDRVGELLGWRILDDTARAPNSMARRR